jgi:hypothetical protein
MGALGRPIEIEPYAGVGPIRLGMTQAEIHNLIGPHVTTLKTVRGATTDRVADCVFVYYDDAGLAEGIELGSPEEPTYQGQRLLHRPFVDLRRWLETMDPTLQVDGAGAISRRRGISIYAPAALKDPNDPVETVMIFRRGYYDGPSEAMENAERVDVIADVYLYATDAGGRSGPTPSDTFSCPMYVADHYYDCRLLLKRVGRIAPGSLARVPISLLDPETAKKQLQIGTVFKLWERGFIGEGKVVHVL